jgi:glycosyltransferase involved in cell wall biosynthesis
LRSGGYRPPIVAVEHGALLANSSAAGLRRYLDRIERLSGALANDAEVAVSDFVLAEMRRHPHARKIQRIYNGVDPLPYISTASSASPALPRTVRRESGALVVAFAGRLIVGKGADRLIEAVGRIQHTQPVQLLIAGDGPDRRRLELLADCAGVRHATCFLGQVDDMAAFWQEADVAVIPTDKLREAFSMTTLESMASARAVLATRNGAIPELVVDGVSGTLVPPGDVDSLAQGLRRYAQQPDVRLAHGQAARDRVIRRFHINDCAQSYLDLFDALGASFPLSTRSQSHNS